MTDMNSDGGSSSSSGGGGAALTAGTGLLAVPIGAGGGSGASATSSVGVLGTVSVSHGGRGSVGIPMLTAISDGLDEGPVEPVDFVDLDPPGGVPVAQRGSRSRSRSVSVSSYSSVASCRLEKEKRPRHGGSSLPSHTAG
jgi:hypothetical protein